MVFSSVYEMFNPLTEVRKQHFWDWFSGDDLNSRWTKQDIVGTGSDTMNDSVDGGFRVTSGATSGNQTHYGFNNKRQIDYTNSVYIGVMKAVSTTSQVSYCGVQTSMGIDWNAGNYSTLILMDSSKTNFSLYTSNGSLGTDTQSTTPIDTDWHNFHITNTSSNAIMKVDGVAESTSTTTLNTSYRQQTTFGVETTTGSAKSTDIRYCEAYNT